MDGRNRLRAAQKTKLTELPVEWYVGDDPASYVISLNLLRRHLDKYQLVELGHKIKGPIAERAAARRAETLRESNKSAVRDEKGQIISRPVRTDLLGEVDELVTSDLVAEALGGAVSGSTLERGWTVMTKKPELWTETKRTKGSIAGAHKQVTPAGSAYDGSKAHESEPRITERPSTGSRLSSCRNASRAWPVRGR